MKKRALVWFRNDLRLSENPAFSAAVLNYEDIIPVFIYAPDEEGEWAPGAASRWWLHYSLEALGKSLAKLKLPLIIRQGKTTNNLLKIAKETDAQAIFCSRRYDPAGRIQEKELLKALKDTDIALSIYNSSLLFEPEKIKTKNNTPFKVFTPFWQTLLSLPEPQLERSVPVKNNRHTNSTRNIKSLKFGDLNLLPKINWALGIKKAWQPGEAGARLQLKKFLKAGLSNYSNGRNRPDLQAVSRLSPHLHFGEISPRTIWLAVQQYCLHESKTTAASECYLRELAWREFAHYLLYHFPYTANKPLRSEFNKFPWSKNKTILKAWQKGKTGYPIVDAGMNELWQTGWLHNRVRMIVASFLVKDLLIPWQDGACWFWDTLVDADLANNTLGWQWTAGCGADAAPYFRIFNPVLQGEKFDPEGNYVRKWLPQLKNVPNKWIHKPWLAPELELKSIGIKLGTDYPYPIIDHNIARRLALDAFGKIRKA